ncbi:hypothetical protein BGZ46_010631 [Entomortierella lignicola]|nr:hypothetical protein BGZ46_010631 [Entomortierella lignicola]
MSVMTATPSIVSSGSFSNNNKTEPLSAAPLAIDIPHGALSALEHARNTSPPSTPPLLSSSASSVSSFDSSLAGENLSKRRLSREFYFPHQTEFEQATPVIIRAKDILLKDHPFIKDAYAEYERLYNADSVMTKDGKPMVRLL